MFNSFMIIDDEREILRGKESEREKRGGQTGRDR